MRNIQLDHHTYFEQAYTFAPIGIALVSMDGTWIKVNAALCKIMGYSEKELLELTIRDITHPDDLQRTDDFIDELLDGGSSNREMEKRYVQKNGSELWTSLHVSLVREEPHGTPLYFISHIIDITEKKAAEQKLLATEELYNLITKHALDIISYNTPDGITRYISPSIREILGYEPEEVIGKSSPAFYHPDDLEKLRTMSLSDNDVITYRVRHKNGSYIWFESTLRTIRNEHGQIEKILGIARDITERKRNEDNLAEVQRIALVGSWEWNISCNKLSLSDQAYEIFSLNKNELLPSDVASLIHPDDRQRFAACMEQAFQGHDFSSEFRQLNPGGLTKYLHIRVSVSFDDHGRPLIVKGIIQDITERKTIESKLQETIERYTSLKKYNHDAVISFDLNGKITNTNVRAEQLTGYSVHEMIGMKIAAFIGVRNLERILLDSANHTFAEKHIDKFKHKAGHVVELITTIAPIIINRETVGYYIIAKDITEQKKLLIAKEAAESTNKAKSEFLAMMSHEIRTPMNGVIGMTDLLTETTDLDAQQQEYVEIISKCGHTLLALINDILDFSKIEAGKTELAEEPFSVQDNISETLDVLLSKALAKNLESTVFIDPQVPQTVIGDSNRLRQVLLNLISNAIKFTYSGGITISVKKVMEARNQVQLQFMIRDTGIGIPEDKIHRLFEPFYQIDHFLNRKPEGTGLGLAISKRLVDLMGGEIWIEPTHGPGATFVFTVMVKAEGDKESLQQHPSIEEDNYVRQPLNILIAEDNVINQLVLQRILESLGYRASIVENGEEAIQAVARETYDLIFMDIQMPVMSGLEATKSIKASLPPERCPYIIAVTANALNGDREQCLAAGMDEYISKPIKCEVVSNLMEQFYKNKHIPR